MEPNEYSSMTRQLVTVDAHLISIIEDLRIMLRQQITLISDQQQMNREQLAINRSILRLLEKFSNVATS